VKKTTNKRRIEDDFQKNKKSPLKEEKIVIGEIEKFKLRTRA